MSKCCEVTLTVLPETHLDAEDWYARLAKGRPFRGLGECVIRDVGGCTTL